MDALQFMTRWGHAKIVSRNSSGKLEMNDKNLDELVKLISADSQVYFISAIGPQKVGKSIWTNFLLEALEQKQANGWDKQYKRRVRPLTGFSYGHGSNQVTKGCGIPDKSTSGIYVWPKPFEFSKTRQIYVLHVNYVPGDPLKGPQDSLQLCLLKLSSVLVELIDGQNVLCQSFISEQRLSVHDLRPDSLSLLVKAKNQEDVDNVLLSLRRNFSLERDVISFFVQEYNQSLHDEHGKISGISQIDKLFYTVDCILDRSRLSNIRTSFSATEVKIYMRNLVSEVEVGSPFKAKFDDDSKPVPLPRNRERAVSQAIPQKRASTMKDLDDNAEENISTQPELGASMLTDEDFAEDMIFFMGNEASGMGKIWEPASSMPQGKLYSRQKESTIVGHEETRFNDEVDAETCSKVCRRLREFVSEEMQSLVQQHESISPHVLWEFYKLLEQSCDHVLRRLNIMNVEREFWGNLVKFRNKVVATNLIKLDEGQKQVVKLIKEETREYMNEMDLFLQENPRGIAESEFSKMEERIQDRCSKRLERKLKSVSLDNNEPSSGHMEAFLNRIKKRAKDYQQENSDNLK